MVGQELLDNVMALSLLRTAPRVDEAAAGGGGHEAAGPWSRPVAAADESSVVVWRHMEEPRAAAAAAPPCAAAAVTGDGAPGAALEAAAAKAGACDEVGAVVVEVERGGSRVCLKLAVSDEHSYGARRCFLLRCHERTR